MWAASVLAQIAIVVLMLKRRLHREYTSFFAYTTFAVLRSVAMYAILDLYQSKVLPYAGYFYSFWITDVISMGLCVMVMYSVIAHVFRDFRMLRRYASVAFGLAVAALLVGAIVFTGVSKGTEQQMLGATLILNRSLLFIQAGLVLLTCGFAAWTALPWRKDITFGIALGFGVQSVAELVAVTMRAELGNSLNVTFQLLRSLSYLIAVSTWLLYIRAPQTSNENLEQLSDGQVTLWNDTLAEILRR